MVVSEQDAGFAPTVDAVSEALREYNGGNLADAEVWCRRGLAEGANAFGVSLLLAMITCQTGRLEESVAHFTQAGAVGELTGGQHATLASIFALLNRNDDAIDQYLIALAMDPSLDGRFPNLDDVMRERRNTGLPKVSWPAPPWRASLVIDPHLHRNTIFDEHRDNCSIHFIALRDGFRQCGIELATDDIHPPATSDIALYMNIQAGMQMPEGADVARSFLFTTEPPVVVGANWSRQVHEHFAKVFTPDDSFVDGQKYIKLSDFYMDFSKYAPTFDGSRKTKFCTMINSAKWGPYVNELYRQRMIAIRWFEEHHPGEFDLYGSGWSAEQFPSYRGRVDNKSEVLAAYRFALCYENQAGIPGYITEKIFDCMLGGCVPIYWGCANITSYIPDGCYIDRRAFRATEDLYAFMAGLSAAEYQGYLDNIAKFLDSARHGHFSVTSFVSTVLRQALPVLMG